MVYKVAAGKCDKLIVYVPLSTESRALKSRRYVCRACSCVHGPFVKQGETGAISSTTSNWSK